jgi:choline dehydrogenase
MSESYDYVIVGAGSAGCVLAARLAEDPEVRVAVIEAGPPDDEPMIHVPIAFGALLKSRIDWDLGSEPEPGLDDRRTYIPRGRVVGGSSSLNANIYMRGHRTDYDRWAAAGHEGWGYEDVLPYFRRSEDNDRLSGRYHGTGGPLSVSDSRSNFPTVDAMIDAAVQAGIPRTEDHNGPEQDGAGRFQSTTRDGLRCSAAVAFLHPAVARGNVDLLPNTTALRLLFDGTRATGVEVLRDERVEQVRAEREVIVSCGAYHSPQLLMLSGIGPAAGLAPLGIEVREDLPVGEGLQDHPVCQITWRSKQGSLLSAFTPEGVAQYERDRTGPMSSNGGEGGAFVRTRAGLDAPDVQFHFGALMLYEEFLGPLIDHGYTFGPALVQPTSRGRVTLRSAVPSAKPRILHNYLATEEDRRSMIEGMRLAFDIGARPALDAARGDVFLAPASDSEADIVDYLQRRTHTVYHPTSTCAMGQVVDSELRVLGFEGLRVVDASVMPSVPGGNTNAPTIMVAEKAADMIRGLAPLPRDAEAEPGEVPANA